MAHATRSRRAAWLAVALACVALIPACAAPDYRDVRISTEYDDHADFGAIRTWDWLPKANAPIQDPRVHDGTAHARLRRVIEAELTSKGLTRATGGNPDVWVHHTVWLMARTDLPRVEAAAGTAQPSAADPDDDEGGLLIELLDRKSEKRLWVAQVRAFLTLDVPAEEKEDRVRKIVHRMFEHYPPKAWRAAAR